MEVKIVNIKVPWVAFGTKEGSNEVDYRQDRPEILLRGHRCWQENVFTQTSEFTVTLGFLPQDLQDLWKSFKDGVEDWVKEEENK